jgi:hypothetical protein
MHLNRRRFLGVCSAPSFAAFHVRGRAGGEAGHDQDRTVSETVDPQMQRLRSLELDESVEPVLVFVPEGE